MAPAGKVPGPPSHDGYEETIYGLEGTLTFTVARKLTELGPGQVLVIPPAPRIASTTSTRPQHKSSSSSRHVFWDPAISRKLPIFSVSPPLDHQIAPRSV